MVSVCLPSDALLQHLPSYFGFSYLGRGVSLHGCSSKAQPLLLTLDKGYLLTVALPDLQRGVAPLGPPAPINWEKWKQWKILYSWALKSLQMVIAAMKLKDVPSTEIYDKPRQHKIISLQLK